jgi:hypothetical protein
LYELKEDKMSVQDTSINTYYDIIKEGLVGQKQIEVLGYIGKYPNSTDKEISIGLGININCVTGRRNELVKLNIIEENGKRLCNITRREVYQWRVKRLLPTREELKKTPPRKNICPHCNGTGLIK